MTIPPRAGWLAALWIAALVACRASDLSDADLLAYTQTTYDATAMQNRRVRLGVHRGHAVLVDFLCVGLCPAFTRRVIHYDLSTGSDCTSGGGVVDAVAIRVGSGFIARPFCVPKVLDGRSDSYN